MASNKILEDTGERMVPEFHKGGTTWGLVYAEHVTRYLCAKDIVKNKVVLDIACGSGYGTKTLAENAKKVYGVDVSESAVEYASKNFSAHNIEYLIGSGTEIPLEDNSVDVVVTFETIEHIEDYETFLQEIKRVLKQDGLAIVSTPNDLEFAEGNHFHVHEFEYQELRRELKKHFKNLDPYFQSTWKYVAVGPEDMMKQEGPVSTKTINFAPLKPAQYLYFYILCSNRKISEKVNPLAALGSHYSDRQILGKESLLKQDNEKLKALNIRQADTLESLTKEIKAIKTSRTYRLAQRIAKTKALFKIT